VTFQSLYYEWEDFAFYFHGTLVVDFIARRFVLSQHERWSWKSFDFFFSYEGPKRRLNLQEGFVFGATWYTHGWS